MSQFLKVKTVQEVLAIIGGLAPLSVESVPLHAAGGRVSASTLHAPEDVPHFDRAVMDGYAVRARDTFGASETLPALLEMTGQIHMGEIPSRLLEPGTAVAIPTGGMLPPGADAVVMVEYTQPLDERTIEVMRPVAPGDHILKRGEDIEEGRSLIPEGSRLRSQDIGVLAALGIKRVKVFQKPRAVVFSTGDEVLPLDTQDLPPGKVRDINSYTLSSHLIQRGFDVSRFPVVPDRLDALVDTGRALLEDHDVVILSGGSSVGARDYTLRVLESFPDAELLVHGIAIRPGKPAILARIGSRLFWGLPGQPMSALMICHAFVVPSLETLEGVRQTSPWRGSRAVASAILSRALPSVQGRTDLFPVVISHRETPPMATPLFGKSAMISILSSADGYVIIPEHVEGLDAGVPVEVHLF